MWEAGQPFSRPIWSSHQATFVNCCFQQRQILQPALSLTSPSSLYLPTGDPPPPTPLPTSNQWMLPSNSEFRSWRWVLRWESHSCICRPWWICTCQPVFLCRLLHPCWVSCCSQFTDLTLCSFCCSWIKSPQHSSKVTRWNITIYDSCFLVSFSGLPAC